MSVVQKTKEDWLEEGKALDFAKRYKRAIAAYDRAIRLDPKYAIAYNNRCFFNSSNTLSETAILRLLVLVLGSVSTNLKPATYVTE